MTGEVEQAKVDWDAMAPRSVFFGDIYFSGDGLNETRHVFLAGNDLERRFARAERFAVAELGFGSGLNMLAAWALWRKTAKRAGARLELLSFEKHPLSRADLARAHQAWPEFAAQSAALVGAYPPPVAGRTRIRLDEDVALTLVFGDAARALAETEGEIDAWFLDGFAPARNPEMWAPEIFAEMARLSGPGATAATFTVAGAVRRGLKAAGFEIEKRPGFGRKREMLTARLETPAKPACAAPWLHEENDVRARPGGEIAVIGGGVAGAALAHALGSHGFNPTIFDPDGLAGGASGNPAGLVMPRLDLGDQPIARFFIAAYLEALSTIDSLARDHGGAFFNPCGVLLKATDEAERARQRKIIAAKLLPDGHLIARGDAIFFPKAGVIDPKRYCAFLADRTPVVTARVRVLDNDGDGVVATIDGGAQRRFDAAVIANARDALKFRAARTLPLSGVMGQIDMFAQAEAPAEALAFGPYAAPAPGGGLVIGATYEKIGAGEAARTADAATRANIAAVGAVSPELAQSLMALKSRPRAGVRCQTPDRAPIVGPVPDWSHFAAHYDDLRLGRKRDYPHARSAPGLFILTGLGSRGLVLAPLAARIIAARLAGAPAPVERDVSEALHPARFFIRALKRSQRIVAK